jgi:hypothetical protein
MGKYWYGQRMEARNIYKYINLEDFWKSGKIKKVHPLSQAGVPIQYEKQPN